MAKVIAVLLVLLGLGGGVGAGYLLRPAPVVEDSDPAAVAPILAPVLVESVALFEFDTPFIIPVVTEQAVNAIFMLRIGLEIEAEQQQFVKGQEPRLRDRLLQVMFDHANSGGFEGVYTSQTKLATLRRSLLESAQSVVGREIVQRVLITDLARGSN